MRQAEEGRATSHRTNFFPPLKKTSATWILENSKEGQGKGWQRDKHDDADRDRERGKDKDRQYARKKWPSKQFKFELNKQILRILRICLTRIWVIAMLDQEWNTLPC